MNKKKKNIKYKIFLVIILFMCAIALLDNTLKGERKLNKVESLVKDAVLNTENVLFYPFRYVGNKITDYKELKNVRKKYHELLSKVDRIESLETENMELRKQLESLKGELNIDYTINDYDFLNATVITRNISTWYNTITINKGSYHGIELDMVVVNSQGLIGKVVSVTTFTSDIRLLTTSDTANKISVRVSNGTNSVNGLITGYDYNTNYLKVEGISNTEKVGPDYYVYTSGLGGIYPSGILIGTVANIKTDEYDLAKIIDVTPIADFNDINYVAILKRKEASEE